MNFSLSSNIFQLSQKFGILEVQENSEKNHRGQKPLGASASRSSAHVINPPLSYEFFFDSVKLSEFRY